MRITKDANERKNEILDVANTLFFQKGYDETTISDIIEKVGIARGTIYYHFKSKEDIMDALIERYNIEFLYNAKSIANDKSIPVFERLFQALLSMNRTDASGISDHIHKPQNALMHQKMERLMLRDIPPILTIIIEDGIKEKLFNTPYPYETIEMVIAYVNTVFDDTHMDSLSEEDMATKIKAFIYNLDRLFGAKAGSFSPIIKMFGIHKEVTDVQQNDKK